MHQLTSQHIKALLFKYFRFKRNMHCVTEINVLYRDIEDFIAFNKKEISCVEIKIDKTDFINDFKTKQKHKSKMDYDKFYFCVPEHLADFAFEFLKNYPNYGLLIAREKKIFSKKRAAHKKIKYLDTKTYDALVLRMSSELANEKNKNLKEAV